MPPAKSKTANHDDSKSETPSVKERNGHGANKDHGHQTNGKLRRVASSTGSTLRDATKPTINGHPPVTTEVAATQPAATPAVCTKTSCTGLRSTAKSSTSTDANTISTRLPLSPTATADLSLADRESVFTPPTMARKSEYRRQTKEDLAKVVRKHFNGQGIQENEIVVGFLHRVRNPAITRPKRNKLAPHASPMP
ncbi:hypothetical protein PG988_004015 [Apiospora saccharicola]